MADQRMHRLIDEVYAAALDSARWQSVPSRLSTCLDTSSAFLHVREPAGTRPIAVTLNADEAAMAAYVDHFGAIDPWAIGWRRNGGGEGAFLGTQLADPNSVAGSEFYQDYARQLGIFHQVGAVIATGPASALLVAAHRPMASSGFTVADQHCLEILLPHFGRALQVQAALSAAEQHRVTTLAALDRLLTGILLLNENETVEFANAAAHKILRAGQAMSIQNNRLRVANSTDATRLQHAVQTAIALAQGRKVNPPQGIRISRPLRRPISVLVAPLPIERGGLPGRPWAALFLSDPETSHLPPVPLLAQMYSLTRAQSRLLQALLNGERLADYSEQSGISRSTALTHLKQLFVRTETSRQSDLIALCLRDLAGGLLPFK